MHDEDDMTKKELEALYGRVATVYELNALVTNERRLDQLEKNRLVDEYVALSALVDSVRDDLNEKLAALDAPDAVTTVSVP